MRAGQLSASGKTGDEVEAIILALEAVAVPIHVVHRHRPLLRDTDDDMVLDVAINGGADALVTNNVRDFSPVAESFGIKVVTPREMLVEHQKGMLGNANEPDKDIGQ